MAFVLVVQHPVGIRAVFVHLMIFLIREQGIGEVVVLGHLATEEQRGMADAPQRHHCQLLVFRKVSPMTSIG